MNENEVIDWFLIIPLFLFIVVAITYVYFFIWAIREGNKRDVLNFGLIGMALLGSPYLAAAFVKITKSDKDRIIVEYNNKNGEKRKVSLAYWLKLKLGFSNIIQVKDINNFCRFCDTPLNNNSTSCEICGEKRVWYKLSVYNKLSKQKDLIKVIDLPKLTDEFVFKGIKRLKYDFE